jgi:hypothetical protein
MKDKIQRQRRNAGHDEGALDGAPRQAAAGSRLPALLLPCSIVLGTILDLKWLSPTEKVTHLWPASMAWIVEPPL